MSTLMPKFNKTIKHFYNFMSTAQNISKYINQNLKLLDWV